MKIKHAAIGFTLVAFTLTGCGMTGQSSAQPDYKQMKQMVVDILSTEDGKKAVQEALSGGGGGMQSQSTGGGDQAGGQQGGGQMQALAFEQAITSIMAKPENKKEIQKIMMNPKFAKAMVKATSEEHKQYMKDLLKEPEYRALFSDVMKDPQYQEQLMQLMKSSAFRKQIMLVMKESIDSPLFQAELMEMMVKANEEAMKPKAQEEKKKGGGEGGGSEGGGGEQSSGSGGGG